MHKHTYKIINDDQSGTLEICTECKKKLVTKKGFKGRVNNKEYLKEHVRDTCQPKGRTAKIFNKYYKIKK